MSTFKKLSDLCLSITRDNTGKAVVSDEVKFTNKVEFEEIVVVCGTGSSGGWTWRKYSDGTFDAWGEQDFSNITLDTSSSNTYYNNACEEASETKESGQKKITLPFDFNISNCLVWPKEKPSMSSGIWVYNSGIDNQTEKTLRTDFRSHASLAKAVCSVKYYIHGKWS